MYDLSIDRSENAPKYIYNVTLYSTMGDLILFKKFNNPMFRIRDPLGISDAMLWLKKGQIKGRYEVTHKSELQKMEDTHWPNVLTLATGREIVTFSFEDKADAALFKLFHGREQ